MTSPSYEYTIHSLKDYANIVGEGFKSNELRHILLEYAKSWERERAEVKELLEYEYMGDGIVLEDNDTRKRAAELREKYSA